MRILKTALQSFIVCVILLLSSIGIGAVLNELALPMIINKLSMLIVFEVVLIHEIRNCTK